MKTNKNGNCSATISVVFTVFVGCCIGYLVKAVMQRRVQESKTLHHALQTLEGEGGPALD